MKKKYKNFIFCLYKKMSFQSDLKFGRLYENLLLNYIHEDFEEVEFAPDNQFTEWDVKISKGNFVCKYEVKADRMTNRTGNVFIEYECNNRPSGISITQADIYAYFVIKSSNDQDCYIIPVKYIKTLIENGDFKKVSQCGDGKRVKGFLMPLNKFTSFLTGRR
jgi:predicted AAA+ superfamily ATPase